MTILVVLSRFLGFFRLRESVKGRYASQGVGGC
jgi:hypothetical protein